MSRDSHSRRLALTSCIASLGGLAVLAGCIGRNPYNPAATQPVTVVDLATTQPEYYYSQPAVASVTSLQFQPLWDACLESCRRDGFDIDRQNYRLGLITTKPLISKQVLEPWKRDTGTAKDVVDNSLATYRRTVRWEIEHLDDGTYRAVPKVLVERFTVLERRITSTIQYRSFFTGPQSLQSRTSVGTEDDDPIPIRYYTPTERDTALEKQIAHSAHALLAREERGK